MTKLQERLLPRPPMRRLHSLHADVPPGVSVRIPLRSDMRCACTARDYNRRMLRLHPMPPIRRGGRCVCWEHCALDRGRGSVSALQTAVVQRNGGPAWRGRGRQMFDQDRSSRLTISTLPLVGWSHPGSSIKPFTLLALLQAGKLDAHTALMCRRTAFNWRSQARLHSSGNAGAAGPG